MRVIFIYLCLLLVLSSDAWPEESSPGTQEGLSLVEAIQGEVDNLNLEIAVRENKLNNLELTLTEKEQLLSEKNSLIKKRDQSLENLSNLIDESSGAYRKSINTWKIFGGISGGLNLGFIITILLILLL